MKFSLINNSARIQLIALCTLLTLAGLLSMTQTASAALLNVDFNDGYVTGDLNTQNPTGDGLNAWAGTTVIDVVTGDLTPLVVPLNYAGQTGTGQRVQGEANAATQTNTASVTSPLTSNDLWFSFLLNQTSSTSRGGINLGGAAGSARLLGVNDDLRILTATSGSFAGSLVVGQTHFILGQVIVDDAVAGVETINLWLDPTDLDNLLGADVTGSGDIITSTGLTTVRVESYNDNGVGEVDFFVIAESKSELLAFITLPPVPEPSSFLLLGLGALGLARHTRRRRARA